MIPAIADVVHDRLDEFAKEEWWDVARAVRPDMTREQFDADWDEFCEMKRKREMN